MSIVLFCVFSIFYGILRRWFGGARYFEHNAPRGLQTVIMILTSVLELCSAAWLIDVEIDGWLFGGFLLIAGYLHTAYWAQKHGSPFDCGRGKIHDEESIRRYNSYWYHFIPDFVFKKAMYGYGYDTLLMCLRYTFPVIPMMFLNIHFFWVGFFVAFIYAYSWSLWEIDKTLWPILGNKHIKFSTDLAEVLTGILFGGGLFVFGLSSAEKIKYLTSAVCEFLLN